MELQSPEDLECKPLIFGILLLFYSSHGLWLSVSWQGPKLVDVIMADAQVALAPLVGWSAGWSVDGLFGGLLTSCGGRARRSCLNAYRAPPSRHARTWEDGAQQISV